MTIDGFDPVCPLCHGPAEPHVDSVDIGIGIQTHLNGYLCDACGWVTFCHECLSFQTDGHDHPDAEASYGRN